MEGIVDFNHPLFLHPSDTLGFTRLKLLWGEYSALVPFASCHCEVSQLNHAHLVQQSQILLMQPLPSSNYHDKFSPKVVPSVLMGYSTTQKVPFSDSEFIVLKPPQPTVSTPHSPQLFSLQSTVSSSKPSTSNPVQSSSGPLSPEALVPKKSSHVSKPPQWLNDFICSNQPTSFPFQYPISNAISYVHLPSHTQHYIFLTSSLIEPTTYNEAIQYSHWIHAMNEELQALESNKTWSVISLLTGNVPIGCEWVYKIKYGWPLFQLDVYNAFLQGDLVEEVYMDLPAAGYEQSMHDYSLFTKKKRNDIVIMLIYVDDLLITGSSKSMIEELKEVLHQSFRRNDLRELKFFLGLEILRTKEGILINQRKYTLELIEETGIGGAKPAATPLELNNKLTSVEYDENLQQENGERNGDKFPDDKSSVEVEYRSTTVTATEVVWLDGLLTEIGIRRKQSIKLFCDSKVALQITANLVYHERTNHIEVDCHFIREKIQNGLIKTEHVSSTEQLAYIFTKTSGGSFVSCRHFMDNAILVQELMHSLKKMKGKKWHKKWKLVRDLRSGSNFLHLLFVDDIILFSKMDTVTMDSIGQVLKMFMREFSQCINFSKSKIIFPPIVMKVSNPELWKRYLGYRKGQGNSTQLVGMVYHLLKIRYPYRETEVPISPYEVGMKLIHEMDSLWVKLLFSKYAQDPRNPLVVVNVSSTWSFLHKISSLLGSRFRWVIKDGQSVKFWFDNWSGLGPLKELILRCEELLSFNQVCDRWEAQGPLSISLRLPQFLIDTFPSTPAPNIPNVVGTMLLLRERCLEENISSRGTPALGFPQLLKRFSISFAIVLSPRASRNPWLLGFSVGRTLFRHG
ncbi:retrovirus-related Pol polyprotein from transposon TNT 1-94 [Gossypium australe]|uniref:Retrovirus-related Pol polyprotein from transposon TNT 1-94 n=1 Tax=Gossypium australe TaxID=47621 RepID=A0A5B6V819_9ROSI|nr:retrovirus-related Pol polyprotein from transposon TNT 1-94 [Gossypium australe]